VSDIPPIKITSTDEDHAQGILKAIITIPRPPMLVVDLVLPPLTPQQRGRLHARQVWQALLDPTGDLDE